MLARVTKGYSHPSLIPELAMPRSALEKALTSSTIFHLG